MDQYCRFLSKRSKGVLEGSKAGIRLFIWDTNRVLGLSVVLLTLTGVMLLSMTTLHHTQHYYRNGIEILKVRVSILKFMRPLF